TALTLSKGGDPAGLLAYLNAVRGRPGPAGQRGGRPAGADAKDNTPPLPADQLAHLLGCYRKLKQLKPEWVTSAYVTPVVMTELKRAKREDEEKTLYREMQSAATTSDKIREVIGVAADRD